MYRISTRAAEIIVCPVCKGDLKRRDDALECVGCHTEYPIVGGIPCLLPASASLTIDPDALQIKSKADAMRTAAEMNGLDSGMIARPRIYYLLYSLLLLFLVIRLYGGAVVIALGLLLDWLFFRRKRGGILAKFLANPLRLRSATDYLVVDQKYANEGREQPTMADWVALSQEASGKSVLASGEGSYDDERYLDILRVYRERKPSPQVVVDIGANDGQAYYDFGIGRERTFIGVDVSRLLLDQFVRRIPDQTAIQADGCCLPLKDDSVDFLFCTETLEHLTDPLEAVREFLRVLRPGGCMMIQSPNAHRLRNLNIFHVINLFASLITDVTLQKKIVHENTWHNATTYHWDFSVQDYRRMIRDGRAEILELRSNGFFFPEFLLRGRRKFFRMKESFFQSIPFVRFLGNDLVLVAQKATRR